MTDTSDKTEPRRRDKRGRLIAAGVATGIGSAALVAALLYANRPARRDATPKAPERAEPTD